MSKNKSSIINKVDRKLSLSFGALVLILMLVVSGVSSYLYIQLQEKEENRLSTALAQILSESISKISFSGKYHARLFVEEIKSKSPEIRAISVESKDGLIIANTNSAKNDLKVSEIDSITISQSIASNAPIVVLANLEQKMVKQVIIPYRGDLGMEIIGVVRISLNVEEVYEEQRANLLKLFLLIFILSILAILIVFILSRHFGSAVRELAAHLQGILDNSPALIYMKDLAGRYIFVNKAWYELFHTTNEEVKGKTDLEIFPKDIAQGFIDNDRNALQSGLPLDIEEQAFVDNDLHSYHSVKVPIRDGAGSFYGLCGISTDITEKKKADEEKEKLQNQLLQSQKLESVGRLAGGVAHDFNNMLTAIMGYTELAIMKAKREEPLIGNLEEIKKAAKRSADLTYQLLAFARKQTINPVILDINDAVSGMLKMLRRIIGEDINLMWKPGAKIWDIKMDPSQLDQILANLCVNAKDAIKGLGVITIETQNVAIDEYFSKNHESIKTGEYVMLTISDNGAGIDKANLEHIFEPFFTTKSVGQGTGLGLATVYGIMQQNEGYINVYSENGNGATFKLYFPRIKNQLIEPQAQAAEEISSKSKGETILLVEDEEVVLNLIQNMLENLGYKTLIALTKNKAIKIAEEHRDKIDLLISDVIMPEMNGKELAETLTKICPNMKCLFMSGYTSDIITNKGVLDDGVSFLQKPFSLNSLSLKIREVFGK